MQESRIVDPFSFSQSIETKPPHPQLLVHINAQISSDYFLEVHVHDIGSNVYKAKLDRNKSRVFLIIIFGGI